MQKRSRKMARALTSWAAQNVMDNTPEQSARLRQYFDEAVNLPQPEREALIERVRRDEGDEMADQLANMLKADEPTRTMDAPPGHLLRPAEPEEPSAFRDGEVVLGRFQIVRLLGWGGMGEVYEAHDQELGLPVALKTVRRDLIGDRGLLRRFKQEVQLGKQVTSPYVCRIHELFMLPEKGHHGVAAFLTMELLKGTTLAKRIKQGPLPWTEAEPTAIELCHGLDAIHAAGMVHRDFKPGNVMLARRGNVTQAVVTDFGLALRPEESPHLTRTGGIVGAPAYMPPEQFQGRKVSPATDVYALGLVLYEMATGKRPFEQETPLDAADRRAEPFPPASSVRPGVPGRVDRVIEKCLEYEPADRFQTAAEVARALQHPSASTAGLREPIAGGSGWRQVGFVIACLALLAAGLLGLRWYQIWTEHKVPEEAQNLYREATGAFQNGNYLTATRLLQEAVKIDSDFVLAHARLADAFTELDSTGEAQREVNQIREELVSELSSAQRTYVHAVHETVRPDANAAIKDYEKLLDLAGSQTERANALVDLGRADERAGKIRDAMQRYNQATPLNQHLPTPFLRRGILESRQGKQKEADADFAKAEELYGTNQEGTAEVDYQRSYVASKLGAGHEEDARRFFQESLEAAKRMHSVALQVRARSRLSAIEYGAQHDEEAGKVANEAIRLAEENGVAYWATDARIRLGNSWIYRDRSEAEKILETARAEAERNQWPRLLALSELSLATLTVQQQEQPRQQQTIDLVSPAYDYYATFGFTQESFQCQALLSRAKSFFGLFTESLQHAEKALELANNLSNPVDLLQAQEAIGSALYWKEDYPGALEHLTSAFHIAEEMPAGAYYLSWEALLRAEALCRLERIDEAQQVLAAVQDPAWKNAGPAKMEFARVQIELYKSQGRRKEVLLIAQRALHEAADSTGEKWGFQLMVVQGLTRVGDATGALPLCDELLKHAGEPSPIIVAEAKLAKARALVELRQWQPARALAEEAGRWFAFSGRKESELLSLWLLVRSYRGIGSPLEARAAARKILDILSDFEHNYGTLGYRLFAQRSEIAEIISDLAAHKD
jgi:tetratricopeptide (TPR) repeat protein